MDGKIIIGTEIDDKRFDRQVEDLQRKADKKQVQIDITTKNIENLEEEIKRAKEERDAYFKEYEKIVAEKGRYEELAQKNLKEKLSESELKEYQAGIFRDFDFEIEELNKKMNAATVGNFDKLTETLEKQKEIQKDQQYEYQKIVDKIDEIKAKQEQMQLDKIKSSIANISSSLTGVIKKVIRWGLAVFSLRSAYMAVRNAINVISQNDEQLKADIDYIRTALAYTLEPVVRQIIELTKQLLFYIGYIIKMWTGRNIFENANKSLKNTNKSAKELRKTLASFDEMNVLNNDGSTGTGGVSPSFDLSTLDFKVPKWLELIGKNKDVVLSIISAITGALITMKLLGLNPILGILGAILGLGIYEFVSGIIKYIKDPSWENFGQVLEGLGITIASISAILAIIGVTSGPIGWIMIAVGGLITLIGGLVIELGKNKASIKDVEQANKDLKKAKENLYDVTQDYTQAIKDEEEAHRKLIEAQNETGLSGEELYNLVDNGKAKYKDFNEQQRKVYDAYVNEQRAIGNVKSAEEKLSEAKKIVTQEAIESELANAKEADSYDKLKESVVTAFREGKISAGEARDYLSRAMGDMSKDSKQTFMEDLPNDIKAGLNPNKYDSFATKFKNWWNKLIKGLDTTIEVTGVAKGKYATSGSSSGGRAKGGIYYPSKLPRLAVGGIINQPGRGLPYHGAYIGERGAEAVVPLTDSQQMALLGETIGKYVTINATIPVYAYNRVVDKQIKRIKAEDDFAYNR